jgi:hypothetical protein
MLPDMMHELYDRLENSSRILIDKMLYIEPFTLKFYQYYELQSGEFSFTELPFISMDGIDFRPGDDIFSPWLGMRIHQSGLFPVLIHDLNSLVKPDLDKRYGCSWGLTGELRVSSVMSVLRLQVYDYKRKVTLSSFDIPFKGMDSSAIASLIDSSLPFILDSILSEEEKGRICIVDPDFKISGDRIYSDHGYLGPFGTIKSFPLLLGLNRFLVVEDSVPLNKRLKFKEKKLMKYPVFIPDFESFNTAVLIGPGGLTHETYTEKDILYAEQLFQ